MKCFFLLLILLNLPTTYSLEAVVSAEQTAFFLSASESAEISEFRVKGNIIFIHGFHNTINQDNQLQFINNDFEQTRFYRSIDRLGRPVYVKASDVLVFYEDERELHNLD